MCNTVPSETILSKVFTYWSLLFHRVEIMQKNDFLRLLNTLYIAVLLTCTIKGEARQDSQDNNSRSVERDSQSYNSESRSSPSRQVKDSRDNFYSGSYSSRSTEYGSQSQRESERSQSQVPKNWKKMENHKPHKLQNQKCHLQGLLFKMPKVGGLHRRNQKGT